MDPKAFAKQIEEGAKRLEDDAFEKEAGGVITSAERDVIGSTILKGDNARREQRGFKSAKELGGFYPWEGSQDNPANRPSYAWESNPDPGRKSSAELTGEFAADQIRLAASGAIARTQAFVGPPDTRDQFQDAANFIQHPFTLPSPPVDTRSRRTHGPAKKLADAPGKPVEALDPRPAKPKRDFVIPTNGPRMVRVNEWRDRLLQASFRGIPFEVETYSMTVGRRTAIYEYPQRDLPSIQDFGLVTKELAFSAYVLGDDYDLQRNNLIQALEFPAPGELVHPYYGRIQCNVTSAKVSENATEYRIAKFELTFVAVDTVPTTPLVAVNTILATDVAKTKALTAYASVKDSWDDQMGSLGKQFHSAYDQFKVDAKAALESYFAAEAVIAAAASTSLDFTLADSLKSFLGPVTSLQAFVQWVTEGGPFKDLFTDDRQAEAIAAFDNWINATVIDQCTDLLLESDWDSYEDLHRASGEVVNAIRALEADTDDPECYDAMVALRVSIFQTVWDIGRLLPHERTVEFVGFVPAVVLSYSLYETPLRDEEIVARNSVVHPSFVVSPVQVLSL